MLNIKIKTDKTVNILNNLKSISALNKEPEVIHT